MWKRRKGSIRAEPNPIIIEDIAASGYGTPTGSASIIWRAQGVEQVEVRVGSPAGTLFSRTGPGEHSKTAPWIVDRTVFFLQDVSRGKPLSREHTLATVEVNLTISPEVLKQHRGKLEENLRLLYDVLQQTPLAGSYWVTGGLLLGWAREGRIIEHDFQDGDFGFFREDRDSFLAALPRLIEAGFSPLKCFCNNDGDPVVYALEKDWANFDFAEHVRAGALTRCWNYGPGEDGSLIELVSEVPSFELAPFDFIGRSWLKPSDHETYLRAIYGNWKNPDRAYDPLKDDLSIVSRRPWNGAARWPIDLPPQRMSAEE